MHRARLVQRLLPFGLGHRVVDDAGAGLHVEHAVLQHRGADRDRGVHVVLEAHVADGARVDAAARRLELVDDLHRPHLRRAADGAGGKRGAQHVEAGEARLQRPFDVGHDVHHVRVALDHHAVGHVDACPSARRGRRRCDRDRPASRARRPPSDRRAAPSPASSSASRVAPRGRVPAIGRSVTVAPSLRTRISGRRADHVEIAEVVVEHVRRRIERAQRAIERQRRRSERPAQPLRKHDLHRRRRRRCTPCARATAAWKAVGAELARAPPSRRSRSGTGSTPARAACAAAP